MAKTKEEKKTTTAKVEKAKGRPMLHWVGKRAIDSVHSYPAQLVEQYACDGTEKDETNLLFHGDNKEVLAYLLTNGYRGKVNLIYIDPPFDSKADYVRKVDLRGLNNKQIFQGEEQTISEQTQYADIWANDTYLQFMYERLILMRELLSTNGVIYVHCDWHRSHFIRNVLDEVFGQENFVNEIIWKRINAKGNVVSKWGAVHETVYFYCKGYDYTWNQPLRELDPEYVEEMYRYVEEGTGRIYRTGDLTVSSARASKGQIYDWKGYRLSASRVWTYAKETMEQLDKDGRIIYTKSGYPQFKRYLDENEGEKIPDLWDDITPVVGQKMLGYPTQKPEELLERIISASSNPNDIVFDCFSGSGTTAAAAQKLGRRWIGCDINKGAIQTTSKRLQNIIDEQRKGLQQNSLPKTEETAAAPNPILSFRHYRINDYDLNIQHNEAFELALEYVGVTRKRTDSFFEGELGKRLVKVVPLNHPCTLLDIQAIETELKNRPDEDRDITMISLGKDSNVDKYLADYNKRNAVNKIDLIELRTDEKYGNFLIHQPAWADVKIRRIDGGKVSVKVDNFNSPTIIQRLKLDETIFRERVTDFRAMIDVLLVDTSYDGAVFNICYSDVPTKKTDLINGSYELPISPESKQVAVKIIDMLGEEVLIIEKI